MMALCPPCSGSGYADGKKPAEVPPPSWSVCRLCSGAGEIPHDILEAFWDCVIEHGNVHQPSRCIGEVVGWRH
jgi:hypothetical protein